jgi:hypothetical protein
MPLPAAIQNALDQADAIQNALAVSDPAPAPADPGTPAVDPAPAPAASSTPTPAPQPAPAAQDVSDTWEQRYRSLQGKLNNIIGQRDRQVEQLTQQVTHLTQMMYAATPPAPAPAPEPELVTQQDVDTFGGDLLDLIGRKAKESLKAELNARDAKIRELEGRLAYQGEQVAVSAGDRFWNRLAQLVPDYKAINSDQGWLSWLGQVDPLTGATRQQLLDAAAKALDADRTAAIFTTFKSSQPVETPTESPAQALQRQVAPSKTGGSAATPPAPSQANKVWTNKEIQQVYDRARRRELSADEFTRLENDINRAMQERRIRY